MNVNQMIHLVDLLTKDHIDGKEAVIHFLKGVIENIGLRGGFHPDEPFENYVYIRGENEGRRMFSDKQAHQLNTSLWQCFTECNRLNLDIYELSNEILAPRVKELQHG